MGASEPLTKHIEGLLARVEQLQQAVAHLYVELQVIHKHLIPDENELPVAVPVAPELSSFHTLRAVDRRSSPRRQANQVLISISSALDDSRPFTGWILDYSANGLGLFVDKRIPVSTFLRIRPNHVAENVPGHEAKVMNCQPYLDGWRLGCHLDVGFSVEDLQRFGLE